MEQTVVNSVSELLPFIGKRKFLLVCDPAYDFLPFKTVFADMPHTRFSEFSPNPLYEQVCDGIALFRETSCELIVAIGGGSAIDVAKCIKLFCKMDNNINYLQQEKVDSAVPLMAVPTTAGTGSESTQHAVIYFEGVKQSISHPSIVPNVVALDASALKTLPVYQKKCTLMDALSQAIESWWSVNSTEQSIRYSKTAISLIKENWEPYIVSNNEDAAKNILLAANNAGRAINITATTAAHAMSYKLTSLYHLPHGHAVALCMPEVWAYMLSHTKNCIDGRGEDYLTKTFEEIAAMVSLDWYQSLLSALELTSPVSSDKKADVLLLVNSVNQTRLKNNPVSLNTTALREMYERIVKDES